MNKNVIFTRVSFGWYNNAILKLNEGNKIKFVEQIVHVRLYAGVNSY